MLQPGDRRICKIPVEKLDAYNIWCDEQWCKVLYFDAFSDMYVVEFDAKPYLPTFMSGAWLEGETAPVTLRSPEPAKPKVADDWRAWAEDKPGFCPCGIMRAQCDYHR